MSSPPSEILNVQLSYRSHTDIRIFGSGRWRRQTVACFYGTPGGRSFIEMISKTPIEFRFETIRSRIATGTLFRIGAPCEFTRGLNRRTRFGSHASEIVNVPISWTSHYSPLRLDNEDDVAAKKLQDGCCSAMGAAI
jgi:hypothetical protein